MGDVSSDKEQFVSQSHKDINREDGREKNLLLSADVEYSKLPDSFEVGSKVIDGFELLRKETLERKVEVGGVLFTDSKDEPKIQIIEPLSGYTSASIVPISFRLIDEENIKGLMYWKSQENRNKKRFDISEPQIYFANSHYGRKI